MAAAHLLDPNTHLTPAAANLLSKFKPFDAKADKRLKARIAERKKHDKEKLDRKEREEAKLIDGQLVVDEDEEKLENDTKLEEGKMLPRAVANHFPRHLIGMPIEDVDPRNREYEETFMVVSRRFSRFGRIFRFSSSPSYFIFKPWNPIRKVAVYVYTHPLFDIVILLSILANSMFMAMNKDEMTPEYTFTAIYTVEAIVKTVARGVFLTEHSYFRDPWNWVDFIVLATAYATIIAESISSTSVGSSLKALKALRVLRVLKTVALVPGLRSIIEALFKSLKLLGDVLIMTVLMFTIFSLLGMQIFSGALQTKCVWNADVFGITLVNDTTFVNTTTNSAVMNWSTWVYNQSNWFMQDNQWEFMVCGNGSMAQSCPTGWTCLSLDGTPNPNNDFTKFDNFFAAFMVSIQLFNTDYWDFLYHAILAAQGPAAFLYFVAGIIFLNFYLANLVQAVVALSYQVDEDDEDDDDVSDVVAAARKTANRRRFVFDPARLRMVVVGPDTRTSSLRSVRDATERHFSIVKPKSNNVAPSVTVEPPPPGDHQNLDPYSTGKPIAVVKPQLQSPEWSVPNSRRRHRSSPFQNEAGDDDDKLKGPGHENSKLYRVSSRPPSAVDAEDLPKIGYWDRNPLCCFNCCARFFGWLKLQHYLYIIVTDPFFELFITASIVINTASMAANYYLIPDDVSNILDQINNACTYIFITEAVLKLTALCGEYFNNRWNWLDLLVVIGSLVDIVTSNVNISAAGFNTSIIRLLRLLRILKLAQSWKTMKNLLEVIFGTFTAMVNLLVVLVIVMFVFAIIGMDLYAGTYTAAEFPGFPGRQTFTPFPGFTGVPEWNFEDFFHAFMLVFRVLCRETYQPMFDCISANSAPICVPYFLAILFLGSYVVLNLFLAVLLNAFNPEQMKKLQTDDDDSKLKKRFKAIRHWFKEKMQKCLPKRSKTAPAYGSTIPMDVSTMAGDPDAASIPESEIEDQVPSDLVPVKKSVKLNIPDNGSDEKEETRSRTSDRSSTTGTTGTVTTTARRTHTARSTDSNENIKVRDCCWPAFEKCMPGVFRIFAPDAPFGRYFLKARTFCNDICNHKAFEYTILGFIFASSVTLCLEDANLEDESLEGQILQALDYTFLGVFIVEMVIKMFAFGIRSYFTAFWTLLDFFIVATGITDLVVSVYATGVNLAALRALRTLRALRPLRAVSRWQGMRIVIQALITAIPPILNVVVVIMIIWLIFAIMGVQFFAGKFWMCVDIISGNRTSSQLVPDQETCHSRPGNWHWSYYLVNFDNLANAYLALFQVATFEGWTTIFQMSIDGPNNVGDQPAPEVNTYYYIYFLIFIVLCSFFLLNLFVGVIIDDFNNLKKQYESGTALTIFMTDSQKRYYQTIKNLGAKKPRKTVVKPTNAVGIFMFDMATSIRFEFGIAFVIGANVLVMATEHWRQEIVYTVVQSQFNYIFTAIFVFEAALKLAGLGWHYFRIEWNVFDFVIVIFSVGSILMEDLVTNLVISPSLLRVFRVLRVGRILRLIRASKGVRKLMLSLMMSIPALGNIASLLFLVIFIYAIIGMNLFGHIGFFGGNLDQIVNFSTFPKALCALFRLATISGWDNMHQGLSFTDDPDIGCSPGLNLTDPNYPKSNPCCNRTAWVRPNGQLVLETGGFGNCGNYTLASFYIVTYLMFTYFLIVNMFAAVILDNYQQASQQEDMGITDDDIERFYAVWEQYDPLATQFIQYSDLSNFVSALDPPLQCAKPNEHTLTLLEIPILQDNKSGEEIIHCLDALLALVRKALGFIDETEDFIQVRENLEAVFKAAFPNRVQTQKVCTTKLRKKQDVAAKTLQRAYRNWRGRRGFRDAARAKQQVPAVPQRKF